MCKLFSCVVTKQGKVFWSNKTDFHEDIIDEHNLKENSYLPNDKDKMTFARIEIINDNIFEKDLSKWEFKIDETIKPNWFAEKHKKACRKAHEKWFNECIFIDGKDIEIKDKTVYLKNSTATLRGNSTATLWENSTATLWGNSTATLRGNSTATLYENSTAKLRGNSTATLWGNSTAKLRGNSTAKLRGNSTAKLWENSNCISYNKEHKVKLNGNATYKYKDIIYVADIKTIKQIEDK